MPKLLRLDQSQNTTVVISEPVFPCFLQRLLPSPLNALNVVPSPPRVIAKSIFSFFKSSVTSTVLVPGTDDGEIVYTVIFLPRKIFATFMDAFSDSFDPNLLMMATLRSFNQNKIFYITLKTVVFWAQKYMGY